MVEQPEFATPSPRLMLAASAVVALSLLLPRPMNFSPLGAFGLWIGAFNGARRAWLYPLGVLSVYVASVGGYSPLVMAAVFLGFAGPAVIGWRWLQRERSAVRVGLGAIGSSLWFFLISNFGSWLVFGLPAGQSLAYHYTLGLPFFRNTLAGDLLFSAVLFGGYSLVARTARLRQSSVATTN